MASLFEYEKEAIRIKVSLIEIIFIIYEFIFRLKELMLVKMNTESLA